MFGGRARRAGNLKASSVPPPDGEDDLDCDADDWCGAGARLSPPPVSPAQVAGAIQAFPQSCLLRLAASGSRSVSEEPS
jgi:hypothetical protein